MIQLFCSIGTLGDIYPVIAYAKLIASENSNKKCSYYFLTNKAHDSLNWAELLPGFVIKFLGDKEQYSVMVNSPESWDENKCRDHHFQTGAIHTFEDMFKYVSEMFDNDSDIKVHSTKICLGVMWACMSCGISWTKLNVSPSDYRHPHYLPIKAYGDVSKIPKVSSKLVRSYWLSEDLKRDPYNLVLQNRIRATLNIKLLSLEDEFDLPEFTEELNLYPPIMDDIYDDGALVENIYNKLPKIQKYDQTNQSFNNNYIVMVYGSGQKYSNADIADFARISGKNYKLGVVVNYHKPGKITRNVIGLGKVDLPHLLSNADAIIHHGGIGVIADALVNNTPQYFRPKAFDQFDNAARLKYLGYDANDKAILVK